MTILDPSVAPNPVGTVPLSEPVNLRDLGGVPITGGVLRAGVVLRADDLAITTDDFADRLLADGLRAVIDLRSVDEVGCTGRGPLGARTTVTYHHVPLLTSIAEAGDDADELVDQSRFGRMYLRMYEGAATQLVTCLAIIAYTPGAVAFHCAAGQDRTGVLAAALLLVLGADHEDIVADYARTGENSVAVMARIAPVMAPLMRRLGLDLDEAARAAVRAGFSTAPMRALLTGLVARHGDPLGPLRAAGLTDGLVAQLRERATGVRASAT